MKTLFLGIIIVTISCTLFAENLTEKHIKSIESFIQKKLSGTTLKTPLPLFSEQAHFSKMFSVPPFSDKGEVETYYVIDGKSVYFFCKSNSQYFTEKIKFSSSLHTLSDSGRVRLVSTGYYNPHTVFTYLAHKTFIEANLLKRHDYFYRSFFPNRPHPAINYAAMKKETIQTVDEVVAFIKMYDQTLYTIYACSVKEHADSRLK